MFSPPVGPDVVRELRALLARYETVSERKARPRGELIDAFVAVVRAGNATPKYVGEVRRYLERLIPVRPLDEVTSVELALALQELAPRARSEAWCVLARFFAWVVGQGDLARSPMTIPKVKRIDVRAPRRALEEDELRRLTAIDGAIPEDRATFYLLAATTGLRVGRLERLKWTQIDFRRSLLSYRTKGQKEKVKPIPSETLARIKRLHAKRKDEERAFPDAPNSKRFRRDLVLAKVERETPAGRLDRHALRTTFCTNLARAGVNLQTAQKLMDHGDPKLTTKIYTRLPSEEERRAIERGAPRLSRNG